MRRAFAFSLRQVLGLGFGAIVAAVLAVGLVVYRAHVRSDAAQRTLTDRVLPRAAAAERLERRVLYVAVSLRRYLIAPDPARLDEYRGAVAQARDALTELARQPEDRDGAPLVAELAPRVEGYLAIADDVIATSRRGASTAAGDRAAVEAREGALERVRALRARQDREVARAMAAVRDATDDTSLALGVGAVLVGVGSLLIGILTLRRLHRPVAELVRVAGALEQGDWAPARSWAPGGSHAEAAPAEGKSELLQVARAFGQAAAALEQRDRELRDRHEEIAAQNEELQAQAEEIQAQSEEIAAQNEELQAQTDELGRRNERLRRTAAELADADTRKNEFLGVLAHELRNPMAPIKHSLELLRHAPPGSGPAAGALETIERQVGHLIRLIEDLLDVTRISRGKIQVRQAPLDLAELARVVVDDHRTALADKALRLELALGPGAVVEGDRTRLAQVIGNLLGNAIKFTDRGGRITVAVAAEGDEVALRVADDGIGLAPELRPRLFQPFIQGDSGLDRASGGLGLGLALVRQLVELHQGQVDAHSDGPGRGTTLTVRLPRSRAPAPVAATPAPAVPRAPASPGSGRRRVLVIDDNVDGATTLQQLLELMGHEVEVAFTGTEGVARARAVPPEIVLCDLGLPELDGYGVARALRADPILRGAILVALTGYASLEDRRRTAEAGFDEHLPKPVDLDRLGAILARATTGR